MPRVSLLWRDTFVACRGLESKQNSAEVLKICIQFEPSRLRVLSGRKEVLSGAAWDLHLLLPFSCSQMTALLVGQIKRDPFHSASVPKMGILEDFFHHFPSLTPLSVLLPKSQTPASLQIRESQH